MTRSADIRAGNLAELFSPGTARTNSVNNYWDPTAASILFVQKLEGSQSVKPETAKTDVYGLVFQPRFTPGFQASVDYYDIEMSNLISSLSIDQEAQACFYNHIQAYCNNLEFNEYGLPSSGSSTAVGVQVYQNLYSLSERGMDVEASYAKDLDSLWDKLSGRLTIHALATHYITYTTNNGVTAINLAGTNGSGSTPNWLGRLEALYNKDSWTFDLTMRGVSDGSLNDANNAYIQCSSGCTAGTGIYKTANVTMAPSAFFFDGSISKQIGVTARTNASVILSVRNLLNRSPPLVASNSSGTYGAENTPAYPQTNTALYDYLGRLVTLGFKVEFK